MRPNTGRMIVTSGPRSDAMSMRGACGKEPKDTRSSKGEGLREPAEGERAALVAAHFEAKPGITKLVQRVDSMDFMNFAETGSVHAPLERALPCDSLR